MEIVRQPAKANPYSGGGLGGDEHGNVQAGM